MERITAISATLNIIILVVLGWLIFHPIDFKPDLEDTFHANEGSIFVISTIVAITLTVGTTLNAIVQKQLRKAQNQNDRNQKVIQGQNRAIIQNQHDYINSINKLSQQINENTQRDAETFRQIQENSSQIAALIKKFKQYDDWIEQSRNRFNQFEEYQKKTDQRISTILKIKN